MKRTFYFPGCALRLCAYLVIMIVLQGMASRPPLVGGPAPGFKLDRLNGTSVKISEYRGKVVLLNFWATWCKPCIKEMPEIEAAYNLYKEKGLVVLAVNFGEDTDDAASFSRHGKLSFPVLLDRKVKVAEQYRVVSLPVTYFIDQMGIVREQVFGGTLTKEQIGEVFHRLQKKTG